MYVVARQIIYGFGNDKSLLVDWGDGSGITLFLIALIVDSAPAHAALYVYIRRCLSTCKIDGQCTFVPAGPI